MYVLYAVQTYTAFVFAFAVALKLKWPNSNLHFNVGPFNSGEKLTFTSSYKVKHYGNNSVMQPASERKLFGGFSSECTK